MVFSKLGALLRVDTAEGAPHMQEGEWKGRSAAQELRWPMTTERRLARSQRRNTGWCPAGLFRAPQVRPCCA